VAARLGGVAALSGVVLDESGEVDRLPQLLGGPVLADEDAMAAQPVDPPVAAGGVGVGDQAHPPKPFSPPGGTRTAALRD